MVYPRRPILISLTRLLMSLVLVGVLLRLLPGTPLLLLPPLLLLAAAYQSRSADCSHRRIVGLRPFRPRIKGFRAGRGIYLNGKVMGLICLSAVTLCFTILLVSLLAGAVLLPIIIAAGAYGLPSLPARVSNLSKAVSSAVRQR